VIYRVADPGGSLLSDDRLFREALELFPRLNISGTDRERAEVRPPPCVAAGACMASH
jgi:hypothetical protein